MAKRATTSKTRKSTKSTKSAASKPKAATKKSSKKPKASSAAASADEQVKIDRRRGSRRKQDREDTATETAPLPTRLERRKKVNRRRQIDPTTCERDYSDEELQFMNALDEYKRANGRMFPTCSEILEVVRGLGYVKLPPSELAAHGVGPSTTAEASGGGFGDYSPAADPESIELTGLAVVSED